MTNTQQVTPASIFIELYNEFKYMMRYGWSARSTERIDDMFACISELENTVLKIKKG